MIMCEEMKKLRSELDRRGIEWKDVSSIMPEFAIDEMVSKGVDRQIADSSIFRTHFEYNGYDFSVIYGYGTYGGIEPFTGIDRGLLECMTEKVNGGEPVGHLTAAEVIAIVEKEI